MAEIEIWDNLQLQEHLDKKNYPTHESSNGNIIFKGFMCFHPNWIDVRPCKYTEATENDRHVVSLDEKGIEGIFSFMFSKGNYNFFHYYPRILEVREDRLKQGVATSLVKRLKEPCFLYGNILMIQEEYYTPEGHLYLKHVINRELTSVPFKIVDGWFTKLEDYDKYSLFGEKVNGAGD